MSHVHYIPNIQYVLCATFQIYHHRCKEVHVNWQGVFMHKLYALQFWLLFATIIWSCFLMRGRRVVISHVDLIGTDVCRKYCSNRSLVAILLAATCLQLLMHSTDWFGRVSPTFSLWSLTRCFFCSLSSHLFNKEAIKNQQCKFFYFKGLFGNIKLTWKTL